MEQKDIAEILLKYELGISSEKENKLIESWYDAQTAEDWTLNTLEHQEQKNNILAHIHKQIGSTAPIRKPIYRSPLWWSAAAAILIAVCVLFFYQNRWNESNKIAAINQFKPGKDQAILKLDDGSTIVLNGEKSGVKIINGTAVYFDGSAISKDELHSQLLTIEVPKGGQYQVTLPDGSKVWLNAASTLKYPVQFSNTQREVSLEGEAYFEVSKNPHKPFIVKSNHQQVKVLGTVFNINSYDERRYVETTLLEGAVQVNQHRLRPGQRSLISGSSTQILPADMEAAIAWKKGYFLFDNEPLPHILATLSRWYNVEFDYKQTDIKTLSFWGSIDKNQSLAKTLAFFESTNQIKFEYQDGKIVIHKK
ncbi:DUF4974 domain-containing protein [Sphingobacterium kitahiroshimense]|uniref:FecR family protein n=1 Tax=Sphingobacterium sp. B16(2022) TaxID=2914044 RepID=UPI00143A41AF|nr:FecR family protein [Sphingobacterium sp. B16(2022)]NJI72343.1 DUF4974 domain-containing protein [Sphingobacterium sp. B16(2022)]